MFTDQRHTGELFEVLDIQVGAAARKPKQRLTGSRVADGNHDALRFEAAAGRTLPSVLLYTWLAISVPKDRGCFESRKLPSGTCSNDGTRIASTVKLETEKCGDAKTNNMWPT